MASASVRPRCSSRSWSLLSTTRSSTDTGWSSSATTPSWSLKRSAMRGTPRGGKIPPRYPVGLIGSRKPAPPDCYGLCRDRSAAVGGGHMPSRLAVMAAARLIVLIVLVGLSGCQQPAATTSGVPTENASSSALATRHHHLRPRQQRRPQQSRPAPGRRRRGQRPQAARARAAFRIQPAPRVRSTRASRRRR